MDCRALTRGFALLALAGAALGQNVYPPPSGGGGGGTGVLTTVVNDTNVAGTLSSDKSTLTLGWQTTLAKTRLLSTAVFTDQANTYSAGSMQTFAASATLPGVKFAGVTADPSSPPAGGVWYRSDLNAYGYWDGTLAHRFLDSTLLTGALSIMSAGALNTTAGAFLCNDGSKNATTSGCPTVLQAANNLSDLANAPTARTNLGLGSSAVLASSAFAQAANNLSDLASAASARSNLGLGSVATFASTAVAQAANNLSDLASAPTARTNLGLGTAATLASSAVAQTSNNLSDLASASSARTNLGLGTAATQASSAFDAAGAATAAATTVAPPYTVIGGNYYLSSDNMFKATVPPALTALSFLANTPQTPGVAAVKETNGNILVGDTANNGPYYYGATAATSCEAVYQIVSSGFGGVISGMWFYDATHSKLYRYSIQSGVSTQGSASYNGTAAPGTYTSVNTVNVAFSPVYHLRLSMSGGNMSFSISPDGGSTYVQLQNQNTVTLTSCGVYVYQNVISIQSLNIQ